MSELIDILVIILTIVNVSFVVFSTWLAWKRTCYSKENLQGSKNYWGSWKERSKDVASSVLKEISIKDLEEELRKRYAKAKRKKSRRIRMRDSKPTETPPRKTDSNESQRNAQ